MNSEERILERAQEWLSPQYDANTRAKVEALIQGDPQELSEAFYRDLEFGTGGLRGIMGVGTNRINTYVIAKATQGFANYIHKLHPEKASSLKVAVACDSRLQSDLYAQTTAEVFAANGFEVCLFESLRPTPELSFAVRHLGCVAGVMITASHNPKEYNGYKAYWSDGAQLIEPHDRLVIEEVLKITSMDQVKSIGGESRIHIIGEAVDTAYLDRVCGLSLSPDLIRKHHDLKIVYTPVHGTGAKMVPQALTRLGFTRVSVVAEQAQPDGNFPTVKSPNPEEKAAMALAIAQAEREGADLVLATDPDADRVGIAIRNLSGEFILLNGNQTGSVMLYYLLKMWKAKGRILGKEYVVKTIVTTELIRKMAEAYQVTCFDVLTGFKYIADIIEKQEGPMHFIGGGEESYGYLAGTFVRDKDAVIACCLIAEMAVWAAEQGKSIYTVLLDLYSEFGFYKEDLLSITKQGKSGVEAIAQMMSDYRKTPPKYLGDSPIVCIKDYQTQRSIDMENGQESPIDLPSSDVLQYFAQDGSKVTVRPSGTEPKIKFYFGVCATINKGEDPQALELILNDKILKIRNGLGL